MPSEVRILIHVSSIPAQDPGLLISRLEMRHPCSQPRGSLFSSIQATLLPGSPAAHSKSELQTLAGPFSVWGLGGTTDTMKLDLGLQGLHLTGEMLGQNVNDHRREVCTGLPKSPPCISYTCSGLIREPSSTHTLAGQWCMSSSGQLQVVL